MGLIDRAHEATQENDTVEIKAWKIIFAECHTLAHLSSYNEKPFNNEDMFYSNDISGNEI